MRVAIIEASPKANHSASGTILDLLKRHMNNSEKIDFKWNKTHLEEEEIEKVLSCDSMVFSFPLYVDGVPSHLLRCMVEIEEYVKRKKMNIKPYIYVIVNNGFFDPKQNMPAIECVMRWCEHCGFIFGQGVGICGGGMVGAVVNIPNEQGPIKPVAETMAQLGCSAENCISGPVLLTGPAYPAFLYKWQAEQGWKMSLKANGLKKRDMNKKA